MKKSILVALLIFTLPFISTAQPAKLGIFDATADWGLEPEFPPKLGEFKIPGRVEVSEEDGDYVYDIYGNGDRIWTEIDEAFFVYTERTGSWSFSAKVEWIDIGVEISNNSRTKLDIMIRELGADSKSKHYSSSLFGKALPNSNFLSDTIWRSEKGERTSVIKIQKRNFDIAEIGYPVFIRETRISPINQIYSEWSLDGENWNFAHNVNLEMEDPIAYGIAILNENDSQRLAHARVSEIKFTPAPTIAERILPGKTFQPGTKTKIRLEIFNPHEFSKEIAVVEHIPDRCSVSEVSADGVINSGTISWNYIAPPGTSELTYTLSMPNDYLEVAFLHGKAGTIPIFGNGFLEPERLKLTNQKIGVWRYWSTEDGLLELFSSGVYPTADGKVWVQHRNSQDIMDGYKISQALEPVGNYRVQDSPDGQLWTVHAEGFQRLKDGEWIPYKIEGFNMNKFGGWYEDKILPRNHNKILYVYPNRLMQFDASTDSSTIVKYATETSIGRFGSISKAKDGGVWVGAFKGLGKLIIKDGVIDENTLWLEYPFPNNLQFQHLGNVKELDNGEIFAGVSIRNHSGFKKVHFDFKRWSLLYSKDNGNVYGWDSLDNSFWIESFNAIGFLLTRVYPDRELTLEQNRYFPGIFRSGSLEDGGVFWNGTQGGLSRYSPGTWQTPSILIELNEAVRAITEDKNGGLWFATNKKLYRMHNQIVAKSNQNIFPRPYSSIPLFPLPNGNVFLYERRANFLIFDEKAERIKLIPKPMEGEFQDIFPLGQNKYLVSYKLDNTVYLHTFDSERFDLLFTVDGWSEDVGSTNTMFQTPDQKIWFGTENGLWMIDRNQDNTFAKVKSYPGSSVFAHLVLNNGKIWIGGRDKIFEYDGSTWTLVKSGGFGNVNSMIQTKEGYILVGASTGIHRYFNESWNLNDGNDGLPNAEVYSIFQDSQNRIWAGTTVGVSLYHPEDDKDPPETDIPEKQNQRTVPPGGEVNFVVTGMDKWKYTEKNHLLYSHKVDGSPWSPYTADTVISVTGLAAGIHKFEVRTMDRNWNESEPESWEFEVLLPWYKLPLFLTTSIMGSLLTLFFAFLALKNYRQTLFSNVQLEEANEELRELDKMKSSFVSQASHDLRTPLTTIKLNLDNLLRGIGGGLSEKQEKVTLRMHSAVNRLTNLINDVLDINRIEAGRMILDKSEASFKKLVQDVVKENQTAADHKQIALNTKIPEDTFRMKVDVGKMERVIGELISNAIKYTPDNGQVIINLSQKENSNIELTVRDTGIGMTTQECSEIWERFYRTAASQKFAVGSGLGLSIAKELVEMHDGTLAVESEVGKGSVFTLLLPKGD